MPLTAVFIISAIGAASVDLRKSMQLSSTQLSLLTGAYLLTNGLLQPVAGGIVDRFGAARCVGVAIVGAGIGSYIFFSAQGGVMATLGTACMGAFFSVGVPAFGSVVKNLVPTRWLPIAMGALTFLLGMLALVGSFVANQLPDDGGWRSSASVVMVMVVPLLIMMHFAGRFMRCVMSAQAKSAMVMPGKADRFAVGQLLRIPEIRLSCFVTFMLGGVLWSFSARWNESVGRIAWDLSEADGSRIALLFNAGYAIGATILALLATWIGPARPIRVATALAFLAMTAWTLSPIRLDIFSSAIVVTALGLAVGGLPVILAYALRTVDSSRAATCVGLVVACNFIGGFVWQLLPPLSTQILGTDALQRISIWGVIFASLLGVAHVLTWRVKEAR